MSLIYLLNISGMAMHTSALEPLSQIPSKLPEDRTQLHYILQFNERHHDKNPTDTIIVKGVHWCLSCDRSGIAFSFILSAPIIEQDS